ncbi:MAG: hypothetical protein CMC05_14380 [Flavobacteriaceae bacterium]|nr:hypothetical protein [Flavobacteriaceae bacterium]|tara:strand:- start:1388 stop:1882 length:495 start_codon:yes stop_codon:yes gene_type:complete
MKKLLLLLVGVVIGIAGTYYYLSTNQNLEEMTKPKGLITPAEIKALDQAYNSRHTIISDSLIKTPDNRSSWYALEEIESYIAHAKQQADSLGYTLDGLRLYAGAYPDTKEGPGLMTMFFVPTGSKNVSEGSMLPTLQGGGNDIGDADGLNRGSKGDPPSANYPQ